jgi:hypothetical protein
VGSHVGSAHDLEGRLYPGSRALGCDTNLHECLALRVLGRSDPSRSPSIPPLRLVARAAVAGPHGSSKSGRCETQHALWVPLQGSLGRTGIRTMIKNCVSCQRASSRNQAPNPQPLIKRSQGGRRSGRSWTGGGVNGALWTAADVSAVKVSSWDCAAEDPPGRHCAPGPAECSSRGRRDPWEMSSLAGRTS